MPDFIFRLPADGQLTDTQHLAIEYPSSIVVSGRPGSGKTVVSIYRFLEPVKQKKDTIFFMFNKTLLASIKGLLRAKSEELFGELNENAITEVINNKVINFSRFYGDIVYDEEVRVKERFEEKINHRNKRKYYKIFFDEGQDLTPAVFAKANLLSENICCTVDNAQNLQGNFPPDEAVDIILEKLKKTQNTELRELESNFRNTKEIYEFARGFIPDDDNVNSFDTDELSNGEKPEVFDNLDKQEQLSKILEIIQANSTRNIGILVNYSNQVKDIKDFLEKNEFSCEMNAPDNRSFSYYYNGMPYNHEQIMFDRMKTPIILTYDSCKGLEFDVVIMPFFNDAEKALTKGRPLRVETTPGKWEYSKNSDGSYVFEKNSDGTVKMWATRNHYYVGATRARTLLYVLCDDIPDILDFYDTNLNNNNFILPAPEDDLPF